MANYSIETAGKATYFSIEIPQVISKQMLHVLMAHCLLGVK